MSCQAVESNERSGDGRESKFLDLIIALFVVPGQIEADLRQ